jgi:hypothetical protein
MIKNKIKIIYMLFLFFYFYLFLFNLFRQKPLNKSIFTDKIQQKPKNNLYIIGYMEYNINNETNNKL